MGPYMDFKQFNESDFGKSKCCHVCKDDYNALLDKYRIIKEKRGRQKPREEAVQ